MERDQDMASPAPKSGRIPPADHAERENLERRERIRAQLLAGQRVASSDIQPGEFFVQVHRAVLRAINTAHRLTAAQRQYLGVLIEYSYGYRSPWAIRDLQDRHPPSLNDWCNWLGGWSSEQVCGVRKQLLDLGVIMLVNGNSSYVALNEAWETWDQELFARHPKHAGAGRKPRGTQADLASHSPAMHSRMNPGDQSEALIHEFTENNSRINDTNPRISQHESMNSPALIHGFTPGCSEASPEAASGDALNKRKKEEIIKKRRHKGNTPSVKSQVCVNEKREIIPSSSRSQATVQDNTGSGQEENCLPPAPEQGKINQPTLPRMGAVPLYRAVKEKEGDGVPRGEGNDLEEAPNHAQPAERLFAVWQLHAPYLPESVWEEERLKSGLARLTDLIATKGNPVTPDELPGLMYQHQSWRDRHGHPYALRPSAILNHLGELRRQVHDCPAPAVLEWQARLHLSPEVQATETGEGEPGDGAAVETSLDSDPSSVVIDDPVWTGQLTRFVPDAEGARDGCPTRDVQMLWGFVRDALRPGLNTARRQHLDALTPAWDPARPRELLLLSGASYTVRFTNMVLLRDINALIDKLLSRFFDRVRIVLVPQEGIEQVRQQGESGF